MAATNRANANQTAVQPQQRMIWRLPTVKFATGLGRSKIYNLMKEGRFPKARRIAGAHVVGWDSLEVEAWISEQLECQ
ncbi:AlpA family phage regulatory protein [Pseudomonas sp. TH05]|jgi:prophage regulatory protein|uniref:helix-turn-helix transcriptional regulator n=1 Tax=unclassified Pseudomonas TaxID=196821 RepID=UPI001911A5AF|nr:MULTISPECIES: AlpA family phage regulatory protein [unclassified Pseudomonas]MBK5537372.1 AlpA family phage regulatory protein [Pseudomonas sp. TH07]MBK5556032.1 AlpA family phage regulatory protein [Pseudomonas sp. TH05]